MKIVFLGTGTSHGVPSLDCMISGYARCPKNVCRESESDPKHRRTRTSLFIEHEGAHLLVDVSPDFRQQALRERILKIDAVLITHRHADHIGGIPDLRSYAKDPSAPLPIFGAAESCDHIRRSFGYVFDPDAFVGGGIPRLRLHRVDGAFDACGLRVEPVPVAHADCTGCFGYRIGPLAYLPDVKSLPDGSAARLRGVDCLILNCLRPRRPHVSHLTLEESMALARRLRPRRCCFIHMCHDIHYRLDAGGLDPWMEFAHDGMRIEA